MTERERPCPSFVVVDGEKIYCEQGAKGHWGTCCGSRDESTYLVLLAKSKGAKA